MRAHRLRAGCAAAAFAATALLTLSACGGSSGNSAAPAGTAATSTASPSGSGPTLQQEQAKVDAAQSAVSAADSDAANDPNG